MSRSLVPVTKYAYQAVTLPVFPLPGFLTQEAPSSEYVGTTYQNISILNPLNSYAAEQMALRQVKFVASSRLDEGALARCLCKIAHGLAVAEHGLDAF